MEKRIRAGEKICIECTVTCAKCNADGSADVKREIVVTCVFADKRAFQKSRRSVVCTKNIKP